MRRLINKEDHSRVKRRNSIILVFFLLLTLVISTIGFAVQGGFGNSEANSDSTTVGEYGDFKFLNQNGLWVLEGFAFRYLPQQVEDIGTGIKPISAYQGVPAYIYSEDEEAEIEIATNLGRVAQRVQKACPEDRGCSDDIPIKTCSDNFIIIKESINNSIIQNNNCVLISGQKASLVGLADQFLFKTLGIK